MVLKQLCKKYTALSEEDIQFLDDYTKNIELFADIVKRDLFVDCPVRDSNDAIVVYEKRTSISPPPYGHSLLGLIVNKFNEPGVIRTLKLGVPSENLKTKTKDNRIVSSTVVPIKNRRNIIIAVLTLEEGIDYVNEIMDKDNQEVKNNFETHFSGLKRTLITEHVSEAILVFHDKIAVNVNKEAQRFYAKLGYIDNIMGMHMKNLVLNDEMYNYFEDISNTKKELGLELNLFDLSVLVKLVKIVIMDIDYVVMIIKDLSEIKKKEKELMLKSVAIKEIHHRVKNNLQTVASILTMQSRRVNDEKFKAILEENVSRILSIASTHEILVAQGIDKVEINQLLTEIIRNIRMYSVSNESKICIDINAEIIELNSESASSVALVINELLSNSFQHGFVDRDEGKIMVDIHTVGKYISFTIQDDGIGFKGEMSKKSLGLKLVELLVSDKLNGKFQIVSDSAGTKAEFSFEK